MHPVIEKSIDLYNHALIQIGRLVAWLLPRVQELIKVFIRYSREGLLQVRHYWHKWSPIVRERSQAYARLGRLNKPIGILLLLWPTLWALWIAAEGWPLPEILLVFVAGVFLMRTAGCVLNDLADRKFDKYVERTKSRPLITGEVSMREAIFLTLGMILIAFLLVLTTNPLTVRLSFAAVFLAMIYPLMKRYTYLPQFVLGLAFGWGIPMAFAAQTGSVPNIAWLLLLGNVLWSVSYDTMYAMVDREDDRKIGVKSTAILFDDADRLIIGVIQIMFIGVLLMLGSQLNTGVYYYAGVLLAVIMSAYQQYLIRDRLPENCFRAFLNNNWLGAAIFFGLFFNYQFS